MSTPRREAGRTAVRFDGLRLDGIGKRFGGREVLGGIAFEARAGECFGVLGENGAGKSTLLRILATLIQPSSGRAEVAGFDLCREAARVRERTALLLDAACLPREFTLAEGLAYHADLHGASAAHSQLVAVAERVGLGWRMRDPLRTFSRGMAQRASLACALLQRPQLFLLDEPFAALDRAGCEVVEGIIREACAAGGTVVLVTHDLDRAARLCDRVCVLRRGRVVLCAARGGWSAADLDRDTRDRREA